MDTFDLPNAWRSCIMHGRQLYYRLVFLLGMNPSLSMEIIAFWLLVEGNGEVDFLRNISSFDGDHFLALVGTGKQFIDAMHGNPVDLKSRSAREFHTQVLFGICFFLNNVCYKILNDLRRKAEQRVAIHDMEESSNSNYHALRQYTKDLPHISTSYHQYQGDCSISGSMPSAIKCLEDMEESPSLNYHVLRQYMKDQPHISNRYDQYQGDCSISGSMPGAIKCLGDMEKSHDSTYRVLHQYMKDQPHTSTSYHEYQGDCSSSMPSAIKYLEDMEESHDSSYYGLCKYMKDLSHVGTSYHQYQEDCPISRSIPSAINCLEDMVKMRDGVQSVNAFLPDLGSMIRQQQNNIGLSTSSKYDIQNHQDMVKMRCGAQSMSASSTNLDIHGLESLFGKCKISSQVPSEWGNTSPQSYALNMDPYVHSPIQHHSLVPREERTLFVTFSNGHPFTEMEVYNFFMSDVGDVESLSIEDPVETRPPHYALVTFGSLDTVLVILDGREKVKFLVEGKHLWARKYVPKRQQKGKNKLI